MGGTASWRPPRTLARQRRSAPRAWGPDQRPRLEHPGTAHTNGIAGGIIANTAPRGTATRPGGVSYRFTFGDLVFDLDMHGGDRPNRPRSPAMQRVPACRDSDATGGEAFPNSRNLAGKDPAATGIFHDGKDVSDRSRRKGITNRRTRLFVWGLQRKIDRANHNNRTRLK